jgi:hypothetical protein
LDLPQPLQRAVGNEPAKTESLQVDDALPNDDSFLAETPCLGLDRPAGISAEIAADAYDPVAGAWGAMIVVQGKMSDPSGGNPIAQGLGQLAASGHFSGRHLPEQIVQRDWQIGDGGKEFGHSFH